YHLLLDTGRELLEQSVPRPLPARLVRRALRLVLPWPARFTPLLRTAQLLRPLLPAAMKQKIPVRSKDKRPRPQQQHARRILLLTGCVQDAMSPQINAATIRVLHALGIQTLTRSSSGCCGAVSHHLGATDEALGFMRRNIDAWWPDIEQGAQAVVVTASGCAPMVKDYGQLLANDTAYADKASRVSELAKDISEIIAAEDFRTVIRQAAGNQKIAFHSPCTLQHAQRITGSVEQILGQAGYTLTPVTDSHLCCGSAGTYSILQPQLSGRLRDNKLAALQAGQPDMIATANIGCLAHMASHAEVPVKHWIEYLDALIP
ncbi:MAG: glycolate oxidase subunit GlcF, partial [Gammaproteobacteria bacterium]|nr:glycolate oxidase subunit GlcF [Gammaproteobacteria bacterium]